VGTIREEEEDEEGRRGEQGRIMGEDMIKAC
jgi:hypothetical protein